MEPAFGSYAPTAAQQKLISLARRTFLKRGTFRPLMAHSVAALRQGPLDMHFMGVPFRLRPLRSSADLGMTFNEDYNGREIRFLLSAIPQGGVFVDIGANVGMYSLPIAKKIAPAGRVIGIEPHPEALHYLEFNRQAANLKNFTLVKSAVGDFTGEAVIETNPDNLGASGIRADGNVKISVRPLIDILVEQNIGRIDALKIDVEGYEDRALMPFFASAPESLWPKALVIEDLSKHLWKQDLLTHLLNSGYKKTGRTRCNLLLQREQ
jgi:FkbM family methyltransferase